MACLSPLPSRRDTHAIYAETYFKGTTDGGYADYQRDEELHRRNARDRLRRIADRRQAPAGDLVDVGCATGFFLDEARRAGWQAAGIDVSAWARRAASERFGFELRPDLAELAGDRPRSFDLVTFFQSLEHMRDPKGALEHARTCLRPEGLVVIETWDRHSWIARVSGSGWQQVSPPAVLYLLSGSSLKRLLADRGFQVVSLARTSKLVSLGLVLGILQAKRPALFGPLHRWVRRSSLGKLRIKYKLGDLITIVARRADP